MRKTSLPKILIFFTLSFLFFIDAFAAKRLALVIGNDNYLAISKLQKAGNDASAIATELQKAGFLVTLNKDLNYRTMVRVVENFTAKITGGDEVVVFFAGHGVQLKTGNYLLPTDIEAGTPAEVEKTAYSLDDLNQKLSDAKPAFSLVIADACRAPLQSNGRSLGSTRGLSPPEPAKGQMVVYSASKGQEALDRLSNSDSNPNSVFTREFITRMRKPGIKIEDIVREVQDAVEELAKTVKHDQRPAIYNESRGNFYFYAPISIQQSTLPLMSSTLTTEQKEDSFWSDTKSVGNIQAFQAYLQSYPNGRYVNLAKANMEKLALASQQSQTATPIPAQTYNQRPINPQNQNNSNPLNSQNNNKRKWFEE